MTGKRTLVENRQRDGKVIGRAYIHSEQERHGVQRCRIMTLCNARTTTYTATKQ